MWRACRHTRLSHSIAGKLWVWCVRPVWLAVCHDQSTAKEALCFAGLQSINFLKAECVTAWKHAFSGGVTSQLQIWRNRNKLQHLVSVQLDMAANIWVLFSRIRTRSSARTVEQVSIITQISLDLWIHKLVCKLMRCMTANVGSRMPCGIVAKQKKQVWKLGYIWSPKLNW